MPVSPLAASYWRVVHSIQTTFGTVEARYAVTVGAFVVAVLFIFAIYRAGHALKDRYNADAVEVVQSLLVTATAVGLTGFLVAVWRISTEVIDALGFVSITPEEGIKALVTFIVFAGALTITRLTKRSVKYGTGRVAITPHQREVAHHAVQILILVPALAFVIALWGIPVGNIFLGAGVLGIVLGFAARKTLSGILSGFVILFSRPFEVGDWIRVKDREGIVTNITVYNTRIRTFNEEHVLIPNDTMMENEITNYSETNRLRLETDVGVDYETDIGAAARVAVEAMEDIEVVASQPKPDVIRQEFADSAVILRLRYWITTPRVQEKWRAQNAVIESVKTAFESEGIKIPFPQRELTGRGEAGGFRITANETGSEATRRDRSKADADDSEVEADDPGKVAESESVDESITSPPADEDVFR